MTKQQLEATVKKLEKKVRKLEKEKADHYLQQYENLRRKRGWY